MKFLICACIAALALTTGANAQQGGIGPGNGVAQPQGVYTLRVCNRSSTNALVATNYIPVGDTRWRYAGWTHVTVGDCEDVLTTQNRIYYARAESEGNANHYWADGSASHCVVYPGPYDFYDDGQQTQCLEGVAVPFQKFESDPGKYIFEWTLND